MMGWNGAAPLCEAGTDLLGEGWMVTGMMGFGFLFTILLFGGIAWLLLSQRDRMQMVAAGYAAPAPTARVTDRAADIVRERYARGEIDTDTYQSLMADLRR